MKPPAESPVWKESFPIGRADEELVNRREFAKSLAWASCATFLANAALLGGALARPSGPLPEMRIGDVAGLAVGQARVFHYPHPDEPCVLVRLDEDRFVAFGQECTHLGCPVIYEAAKRQLDCPCHEGYFDAETGAVISGPPLRPLPQIALERRGDELWAVGVRS